MRYTLEQLNDLEDIKNVARRYCRGVDRLDPDEMKSAYWPDATDDHGVFDDNGLAARGESYTVSYLLQKDSTVLDTWHGRYLDLYEKREGEWRIIERVCVHEFTMSEAVSAMEMDASKFRQGAFDRPANSRPIGP